MDSKLQAAFDKWEASLKALFRYLEDASTPTPASTPAITTDGVVGPVPASSSTAKLVTAAVVATDVPVLAVSAASAKPFDIDTTGVVPLMPTTRSTKCPSRDATASTSVFTLGTTPTSATATIDVTSLLAASVVTNDFATPSRLLQAAAPALTHELKVLRPRPWPSFKCQLGADYHEESMSELFDKSQDATAAVKEHKDVHEFVIPLPINPSAWYEQPLIPQDMCFVLLDAHLMFEECTRIVKFKLRPAWPSLVQAHFCDLRSLRQLDTDPTLAMFLWNPGGYLPRNRNQRTMVFTTTSSGSHWPVSYVIVESWHCSSKIATKSVVVSYLSLHETSDRCLFNSKSDVFAWVKLVTETSSYDTSKDNRPSFLGWEIARRFYLEYSDGDGDKFRPPPGVHGPVPVGEQNSGFQFWVMNLLFNDDHAHEAWSDYHVIDTCIMSKIMAITSGDETRYGVATRWSGHDDAWLDIFQLLEFFVKLANLLEKLQKYFIFLVDLKPWPSWELSLLIVTLVRTISNSCHKLVLLQKFLVEGAVNIQFSGPLHGTHGECWLLPFPSGYHKPNPWFLQCTALNLASTSLDMVVASPSGLEEGQPNAMLLTACVVMLQTTEFYSIRVSSWQYAMPVVNQWILMGCSPNTWNSFEVNLVIAGFLQAWVSSCLTRYIILGTFELMQWKIPWLFNNPLLGVWFQFFPTVPLSHCIPRAIHLYLSLKCSTGICYLEIQIRSSAICSILVLHLAGMLNIHNVLPTVVVPIDATYSFTSTSDAFYSNERGLCPTASELLLPQSQGYKEPCFHIRDSWGSLKIRDGKDAAIHIVRELFLPWDPGILGIAVEDISPFGHQVLLTIPCSSLLDGEEFSTGFGQAPFQGGRSIMVLAFFVGHDYYPALVRVNSGHVRLPQRPPQSWSLPR